MTELLPVCLCLHGDQACPNLSYNPPAFLYCWVVNCHHRGVPGRSSGLASRKQTLVNGGMDGLGAQFVVGLTDLRLKVAVCIRTLSSYWSLVFPAFVC